MNDVSARTRWFLKGGSAVIQSVITRRIVVAGDAFAPGHLGELTRIVPFEMVDAVLADCGAVQRRVRKLPVREVVCLLLAAALFGPAGYLAVWGKLTSALEGAGTAKVTARALRQARTRLGPAPLRALFDLLRGLLVCAIDGTLLDVPDTPGHRARLGKQDNQYATAGYPQIWLVTPVGCGTPRPGQPAARTPPACQSPRCQAAAVALRLQEPARGPAHLQGNDRHRHLDDPDQPLTTRPCIKGPRSPPGSRPDALRARLRVLDRGEAVTGHTAKPSAGVSLPTGRGWSGRLQRRSQGCR